MRAILSLLALLIATACYAAPVQYYGYPDATSLPDAGRILMWDGSASKNITGSKLKTEIINSIATPSDTALTKQPATSGNYKRQVEVKDSTGKIVLWINASGQMVFGTPVALAVSSVSPANGATSMSVLAPPVVTFNKPVNLSLSTMYLQGNTTAPTTYNATGTQWGISATPLAYGTTYTVKVVKNSITQTDGETSSSCGSAMTDVSGVCQSTWTTALLGINAISVDPADQTGQAGTDGGAFTNPVSVTFSTEVVLAPGAGSFACSSSYYNGSQWQTDSASGDYTSSDIYLTYALPDLTYHKSYDSSHRTTYTCSVVKSIGISSCSPKTNDDGTNCYWTFYTAL